MIKDDSKTKKTDVKEKNVKNNTPKTSKQDSETSPSQTQNQNESKKQSQSANPYIDTPENPTKNTLSETTSTNPTPDTSSQNSNHNSDHNFETIATKEPSTNYNPVKAFFKSLEITILLASIFFATFVVYQDFLFYQNNHYNTQRHLTHYYYNGWDVKDLKKDFDKNYFSPLFGSYLKNKIWGQDINKFHERLNHEIDKQRIDMRENTTKQARASSMFYIKEIQQNTTDLEKHFAGLETAADIENHYLIEWELQNINKEIAELSVKQEEDIKKRIKNKKQKLKDIVFFAKFYSVDLSNSISKVDEIAKQTNSPIEKFIEIDTIIQDNIKKLQNAIKKRGGQISPDGKRILLDISAQHLYMIEDHKIIYDMPASTGVYHHATVAGEFKIHEKIDMAWGYYEIWMPYWMTIYYAGSSANGIHGIPISPSGVRWSHWEKVVGVRPITYGCVMPKDKDAKKLYNWANVGTPVTIFY